MNLSIELVPRRVEELVAEAGTIARRFEQVAWLNIPDIRALSVRSHDAAYAAVEVPLRVIPHIRARDREIGATLEILRALSNAGITDALIVTGDRIEQDPQAEHATSLDVIRAAERDEVPIALWAAFDPYRGEMRAEFEYVQSKMEAGAVGLFTQPFFDVRLAEMCLEQLEEIPTFIGISPVTTDASRRYWERTNRVVFPPSFVPTLEYCTKLSVDLLAAAEAHDQHAYLMPIKVDPVTYLESVFNLRSATQTVS